MRLIRMIAHHSFTNQEAQAMNVARIEHLKSLKLPISDKTVNEYGSGPGLLTSELLSLNCKITSYEGREENVIAYSEFIKSENARVVKANLETEWDIVIPSEVGFAYGLLYHLANPVNFIYNVAEKTKDFIILETVVIEDKSEAVCISVNEDNSIPIQSLSGNACRPTRRLVWTTFKEVFPFVYVPKTQPNHPEFPLQFEYKLHHTSRFIIIGSKNPIENPLLSDVLLRSYASSL